MEKDENIIVFNEKIAEEILCDLFSEDLFNHFGFNLMTRITRSLLEDKCTFVGEGWSRRAYELNNHIIKIEVNTSDEQTRAEIDVYENYKDITAEIYAADIENYIVFQEKLNTNFTLEDILQFTNSELEDLDDLGSEDLEDYFGTYINDIHQGNIGFNSFGELKVLDLGYCEN